MVIQDNVFADLDHGAIMKFYDVNKVLVEDNTISNIYDTTGAGIEGIALKANVQRPTVRHNIIHDVPARGIGGNMNDGSGATGDFEILFNDIYNASTNAIEINQDGQAGVIYVYRNTFVGLVDIRNTDTADGPFYFNNNVIVNNSGSADHIACAGTGCSTQVIKNNNLSGYPIDNIVDAIGNLIGSYTQYIGSRGWQLGAISSDTTPPSPPQNLSVN